MLRNNFENVERNFFFHNDQLQFNHVDMITDEVSHCRTCTNYANIYIKYFNFF